LRLEKRVAGPGTLHFSEQRQDVAKDYTGTQDVTAMVSKSIQKDETEMEITSTGTPWGANVRYRSTSFAWQVPKLP
jgi:hypothetical protein